MRLAAYECSVAIHAVTSYTCIKQAYIDPRMRKALGLTLAVLDYKHYCSLPVHLNSVQVRSVKLLCLDCCQQLMRLLPRWLSQVCVQSWPAYTADCFCMCTPVRQEPLQGALGIVFCRVCSCCLLLSNAVFETRSMQSIAKQGTQT